jgi:DEAD/DEAH box helicase/Helicase conserved C-terminal domain
MPGDYLEVRQIRDSLSQAGDVSRDGFRILTNICRLVDEGESPQTYQELILRALENRSHFGSAAPLLDALVRQVGLFPYLNPAELGTADEIAWEFNRPLNMPEGIVFHEPQSRIYRALLKGSSVVLSAPTSFGKSLITDAVIASKKFRDVLIVVPTIALIDETRRRLSQRFGKEYKIITHASQEFAERNIFVLTQERVFERDVIDKAEFVVIDEFYKLSPNRDDDERCARLNEVFYRVLKSKKQFYLLGPNVQGVSERARREFRCEEFYEDYRTVVSEIHDVNPGSDPLKTLADLCATLKEPTIIFCSSPNRAAEVAQALIPSVGPPKHVATDAADWVAENYHPDWHFVKGLREGVGIHHGRIPRALAHYVVAAFNSDAIRFLVCTSTLIEGVNTKAKNVIIYDDKINKSSIDFFTFNNIKGRSGRMGQHYIGHVYLFNPAPSDPLPFVDIPVLSQPDDASPSLLMQIDDEDLTLRSKKRLEAFLRQEFLDYETLRSNIGIDPQAQIDIAKEILGNLPKYGPLLRWTGMPKYAQIYGICNLIWKPFRCSRLGAGTAVSANQLGVKLIQLHDAPTTKKLIQQAFEYTKEADAAVQQVLDFLKLWAGYHFPQLLRALDRIQKDVFRRAGLSAGDYSVYAARIENRFLDPSLIALEEYGIPLEVAVKLRRYLSPYENLDGVLKNLRRLAIERINLSKFERAVVEDAQRTL